MKKASGDVIILLMCTINENNMMYGSWDIKHDRIFVIFAHLTPLTTQKIKILKKRKNPWRNIIILLLCTINENDMMYCSWHMKCTDRIFCHFLPFYSTKNPKHRKFWKHEKKPLNISSFYISAPKIMIIC